MDEALRLDVGERASIACKFTGSVSLDRAHIALVMILFIGYVLFELPSNMVLKKVGPRIMLSGLGVCFGLITIACGLINSWGALAALRVVLGIFEAVCF
jgi:MFS family permease